METLVVEKKTKQCNQLCFVPRLIISTEGIRPKPNIVDDYKISTDDLIGIIRGLRACPKTISSSSMFGLSISPEVMCNLLDRFDKKLFTFSLWLSTELESSHSAGINIIRILSI